MNANWVNHLHGEIEFLKSQLRLSEEKCGRLEIELASQNMAFSQLQRDHQLLQSDHSLLVSLFKLILTRSRKVVCSCRKNHLSCQVSIHLIQQLEAVFPI
jgi:hypothetical protein